ncbi:WD40-repeat-containing domain protein [Pterulicium gracile]|uniref:Ribosome biogenesis protein NSA1 n=1 Tax=Pterulicium gracile TaxID=1884261 RepID=A0A5C3QY55_9AGAR|nr:WD40-repeat-containing domain protein [Pterula gracilis]
MPRFIAGDELGNLKTLSYDLSAEPKSTLKTIRAVTSPNAIQALASSSGTIAAAHGDGSLYAYALADDEELSVLAEWKEDRISKKSGQKFVGIDLHESTILSCTSTGALRSYSLDSTSTTNTATLPTRLTEWKASPDRTHFAYGGDEVELSVWDTQKAFEATTSPQDLSGSKAASKKRKRNDALFEGEVWRAKNVANDNLGLRQPVRISTVSFVTPSAASNNLLITGTEFGNVRRYDTRASGRRPTSDWSGFTQGHGISKIECGHREHEAFVADVVNGLHSLDLRNGKVLYKYKGLSGAVTSIAPSPSFLASASLDRLCRVHSTVAPPREAKVNGSGDKGDVVDKVYMTTTPTVVVWDGRDEGKSKSALEEEEEEDVWEGMENIEDEDDDGSRGKKRKKT